MNEKSQSSIEFMILVGAVLFIFITISLALQTTTVSKSKEKRALEVQNLALIVRNEIDLAFSSLDGYERTFNIPQKIINLDYTIILDNGVVYIITEDSSVALSLSTKPVTGQLQKGDNLIRKMGGELFLNQ
jgi:hypothetical protein